MVKEFLSQNGIDFREVDVSRDQLAAQEMVSRTGQRGVPVTIIDGDTVIGFDQARLESALARVSQEQRPSLGAAVADASKILGRRGEGTVPGAYVGGVRPDSAAEKMGLIPGDIIIEIDKQNIANAGDLARAISKLGIGSRFLVVLMRD
jgi:glutaredoxin 3